MEQANIGEKGSGLSIEGHSVEPRSPARLPVIKPVTNESWATMSVASTQDVEQAVDVARRCFESTWSRPLLGT